MDRPLSQLIHFPFQAGAGSPTVMTLHRYNAFADSTRTIGLAINPHGRVLGIQASKGVYIGRNIVGYAWFVGPLDQPSPVHFGDGMIDLERFLWDEIDNQSGDEANLPFLVGEEQGAIMSLAMAGAVPDLLSGVIAFNATLPTVYGWEPPLAPLDGLPILLVDSQGGETLTNTLEGWGATVSHLNSNASGEREFDGIRDWFEQQPVRTIRKPQ